MPFGVDEAGRGPVLGSMFAAAVWVPERDVLPPSVDDSKRLSGRQREEVAESLASLDDVVVGFAEVPSERIDDPETDMNGLAVEAHANAIDEVFDGAIPDDGAPARRSAATPAGICDACDVDAERFARRVEATCETDVRIDARHHADEGDPLVAAASVLAKVARDAHVADLAATYGDLGSGYPSDPKTRSFLRSYVRIHGDLPSCARRSWSTCADLLASVEQSGLDDF